MTNQPDTAVDRPEVDDPRVLALAKARQQIAYESPLNFVCPPWDGLTEDEQQTSLLDARNYLHAVLKAGLAPAAAAPSTDQAIPSGRAGLREALRRAVCEAEGFTWDSDMLEPDEYGDHADHVLAVLYREWPWLRAEAEADELGTDLYRAQDALAFVGECCAIADREQQQVTTTDVREWLKGTRYGRQLLTAPPALDAPSEPVMAGQDAVAPRTERARWVDIAAALNAAHAAGMAVGIDLDGTLTDHTAWSVIWDPTTQQWTVAGYDDEADETPCACTLGERCDQCADDDQDEDDEEFAPLQVRTAIFPPVGFSTAPAGRAWFAGCRPCGSSGVPLLIARSPVLDRAGWQACMTAAHAHIAQHKEGGRL